MIQPMKTGFSPNMPLHRRLLGEQFPAGAQWEGSLTAGSERLASAGLQLAGPLHWSARLIGSAERGADRIELEAGGRVALSCTRCLGDLQADFSTDRCFRLFDTTAEADAELALDDGRVETLATEDGLSLLDLIDDELLLAMDELMQHEGCAVLAAPAPEARQRPFAELASLLHSKGKQ